MLSPTSEYYDAVGVYRILHFNYMVTFIFKNENIKFILTADLHTTHNLYSLEVLINLSQQMFAYN